MLPGQKTLSAPVVNVTIAFCGPSGYKVSPGLTLNALQVLPPLKTS